MPNTADQHPRTVLITGHSRGLGAALADHYLQHGDRVIGLSRSRPAERPGLQSVAVDLRELDQIKPALAAALGDIAALDLVILNAGVLGKIDRLANTGVSDIEDVMRINVWSNKVILDALIDWQHAHSRRVRQIVLMSSGAAVNGNKGWNAYGLSKATLNMLTQLYAHELPETHLCAFAPGIIDTGMQDYLCEQVDVAEFPSMQALINARASGMMPNPEQAAAPIAAAFERVTRYPSGRFLDIRRMDD